MPHIINALYAQTPAEQIAALNKMISEVIKLEEIINGLAETANRTRRSKTSDGRDFLISDFGQGSEKALRSHVTKGYNEIVDIICHLYLQSPHEEILRDMGARLDKITENEKLESLPRTEAGPKGSPQALQNNLYLLSLGGRVDDRFTGVWHKPDSIRYNAAFNGAAADAPACDASTLRRNWTERGLTEMSPDAGEEEVGTFALTLKGRAILARLTEKLGEPAAARQYPRAQLSVA